jgi:hypothetical protein
VAEADEVIEQPRFAAGGDTGEFYNFAPRELVRIGTGPARILQVAQQAVTYVDGSAIERSVDLQECARTYLALYRSGNFPPTDDADWTAIAAAHPVSGSEPLPYGCVGLRAVVDDPLWFQFLDHRRTQFEFADADAIRNELVTPLARLGWQTWDAS